MTSESNKTGLIVNGSLLSSGDGAFITPTTPTPPTTNDEGSTITLTGNGSNGAAAEFLLFDIKPNAAGGGGGNDNGNISDDDDDY
jgi:hypothetical protein